MRHLVISIALVTACGTDPVAFDDYVDAARDAFCRRAVACGDVESLDTCRKINRGRTFELDASLAAAVDMGKIKYNGEKAATCLDVAARRSCDVTSQSGRVEPEVCGQIFVGTLPAGAPCAFKGECISGVCDAPQTCPQTRMGICQGDAPPGHAKLGESCEHAFCQIGSFCDTVAMMCVALQPSGGFCRVPEECQFGLDCSPSNKCVSLPQLGESCDGACRDVGTTCAISTSQTCVKVALAGQPCAVSSDCASVYVCDASKHCSAGIALGGQCTMAQRCADDHASCYVPDGETLGTCIAPRANGEACVRAANCESLYCDQIASMCADPPICI